MRMILEPATEKGGELGRGGSVQMCQGIDKVMMDMATRSWSSIRELFVFVLIWIRDQTRKSFEHGRACMLGDQCTVVHDFPSLRLSLLR